MTERSIPWNGTTVGDAGPYSDADWQRLWRFIIGLGGNRANVGVFLGSGTQPYDGLAVTAPGGTATVVVNPGAALVNGIAYINDSTETLNIAANASGNPRIDMVVLQADYALQEVHVVLKQGTPAASPVPPALTQVANTTWEIPIADIAVANGFVSITQANITPRQEWINAANGVYLDNILNNSGAVLEDGDVVVWDTTAARSVTTTTTLDNKAAAGIWRGRTDAGGYGRVQQRGVGYVRVNAAVTNGNMLVTSGTAKQAAVSLGAYNKVLGRAIETTLAAGLALCSINVHTVKDEEYILIRDEKANGVAPASITSAGWRQRELNTEVFDTGGFASVASNQITLEAGTYEVIAGAGMANAQNMRARLQNITAGATLVEGSNTFSGMAQVVGQFTITVQSVLQLQHYVASTTTGGAALSTGDTEKYAWVYLVRKAETP